MKKWFEDLKILNKLRIGFFTVTLLGILISIVGIMNLISLANNQKSTYYQCTAGISYASKAEVSFFNLRAAVKDLYIYYNTDKKMYCDKIAEYLDAVELQISNYSKTLSSSQDQEKFESMKAGYESYKGHVNTILKATETGKAQEDILSIMNDKSTESDVLKFTQTLEEFSEFNDHLASERLKNDMDAVRNAIIIMIAVTAVSFIIALLLSNYTSRIISNPIHKFAAFAEMLAVGDIAINKVIDDKDKLLSKRKDEVGILADSFNKVIASDSRQAREIQAVASGDLTTAVTVRSEFDVIGKALSNLVKNFHDLAVSISLSANQVDSGAKLVENSSTSLSQGATEQASSIEELTASIEEITSQTEQNAQNAKTTDQLTQGIKKDAEAGNYQMENMLNAMDEINVSSNSISKIIKVIDDIAFQTNILALNAAVEAARAGQYGKGFAVVAEEVRNLAARSAEAAKETTELIEDSIEKVQTGTTIAKETANEFGKIVSEIGKTSEYIDLITAASNEQAMALKQINEGIEQVSQVVQSNAAASEECAAASEELANEANGLKKSISIFQVNADSL